MPRPRKGEETQPGMHIGFTLPSALMADYQRATALLHGRHPGLSASRVAAAIIEQGLIHMLHMTDAPSITSRPESSGAPATEQKLPPAVVQYKDWTPTPEQQAELDAIASPQVREMKRIEFYGEVYTAHMRQHLGWGAPKEYTPEELAARKRREELAELAAFQLQEQRQRAELNLDEEEKGWVKKNEAEEAKVKAAGGITGFTETFLPPGSELE